MNGTLLLDTDVLVDVIRQTPPAQAWFRTLTTFPCVSGIAALELAYGCRTAADLTLVHRFLSQFPIAWPEPRHLASALGFANLHLSAGLGLLDSVTAALAVDLGMTVGTFNVRHFRAIPGLAAQQPYRR